MLILHINICNSIQFINLNVFTYNFIYALFIQNIKYFYYYDPYFWFNRMIKTREKTNKELLLNYNY